VRLCCVMSGSHCCTETLRNTCPVSYLRIPECSVFEVFKGDIRKCMLQPFSALGDQSCTVMGMALCSLVSSFINHNATIFSGFCTDSCLDFLGFITETVLLLY
jgi:hypothetical protein